MVKPAQKPVAIARLAPLLAAVATGCALVPKSRLDDAAKVTQTLRAENAQLRDQTLRLRSENQDLSERALGDARKIAALERGNDRLQESVQGYIDERENLVEKFQQYKRVAQATTGSDLSAGLSTKLRTFASAHPGTTFDGAAGVVSIGVDALFAPGGDRVRPGASRWLDDLAAILAAAEAKPLPVVVSARGSGADAGVRPVSTAAPTDLALTRAGRVRDALAERAGRDRSRIGVAAPAPGGRAAIEVAFGSDGR
jgi:chemotaxis protein MotB